MSIDSDALMRLLNKGTIVYTGTVAYVRLDAVQDAAESLEPSCEFDCSYCQDDEDEPEPIRCTARCSQYPNCQHDWSPWMKSPTGALDPRNAWMDGKPGICTCLAGDINYCEVHDEYGTEFDEYEGPES